ncbi:hypothetical protein PIB30_045941 [Stylosanthes scabra]|uniref:PurT/PurK-like preATP-grasp domain-containing protein n=1 Tax=Stylosanthes scabra TaxID=79078 RepID=A0ABU6QFX4_9FABA|nr:hypothetical protein [Stylosanthes scabra]
MLPSVHSYSGFGFRPCLDHHPCSKSTTTTSSSAVSLGFFLERTRLPPFSSLKMEHSYPAQLVFQASQDPVSISNDELPVHGLSEVIVGVLGGGQLGRMLCQAASQMAIKVMVLDPQKNCPASSLSYHHMVGSFDDSATVEEFAKSSWRIQPRFIC